jgi:RNA polymerase sigma factor (sigma-70 family)
MDTSVSLLVRLQDSPHEEDWQRLHTLYVPLLKAWTARAGLKAADSADLVQEVMLVLIKELSGFERQRIGSFRAWLRTIWLLRLRTFFRQQARQNTGSIDFQKHLDELEDPASSLSQLWDQEHDIHIARRVMQLVQNDFATETWQAFRMQVLENENAVMTAQKLGMSVNAVLIAKSRVLKRLRNELAGIVEK